MGETMFPNGGVVGGAIAREQTVTLNSFSINFDIFPKNLNS